MGTDADVPGPLSGRTLGGFVVETKLGEGGMGEVYVAQQPVLAREAVIKTLRWHGKGADEHIHRFLREARVASSLDHPYAAHIYAFGAETDGTLWIAMERVNGSTLAELIASNGPLSLSRLVPLVERICEVVHTAHERGIVHRDLKPQNIMVLARAGRLLPKLLDFGIAKALAAEPLVPVTAGTAGPAGAGAARHAVGTLGDVLATAGIAATELDLRTGRALIGTPHYMAPEQWVDPHGADRRTDIYALGAVIYEALTGELAFKGDSVMQVARAHARTAPPHLPAGFPEALDRVLQRAMAKVAADRFATALELAAAVRAASGEPAEDAPIPALEDALRDAVLSAAPQPIADAVAGYEAATAPDRAARALIEIAATAVRYLGAVAISVRARTGGIPDTPELRALIQRWRERGLAIADWIELTRQACAGFVDRADVFPIAEIPLLFAPDRSRPSALAELAAADLDPAAIAAALPATVALIERVLGDLRFLSDYPLVAHLDGAPRSWMGARRRRRAVARLAPNAVIEPNEAVVLDDAGAPLVSLFPIVQIAAPAPGSDDELFVLDRGHHLGAVLVAHPIGFERHDDRAWSLFGALADGAIAATAAGAERSPYRGLASFAAGDADWFFGREAEAEAFANQLRERAFIAVVGPSGVGKSSFVKAGVLPRLGNPTAVVLRPGDHPLAALAAALSAARGREITAAELAADADAGAGALRDHVAAIATDPANPAVIVVDQFEELVTLCRDPVERNRFASLLAAAGDAIEAPMRVVVTLRDDFLVRVEEVPALRHRLGRNLYLLTTPVAADLIRIVREPARKAGYDFDDPELPARIVADVEARPGALALLSFTALRLWELRDERYRRLKRASYDAMGGVGGALARHAEDTLAALDDAERPLVREVFRHLVTAEGTRAVLSKSELAEVLGTGERADAVIQELIGARLLASAEGLGGDDTVEVVHEALLSAWPRLVEWRREDAETARLRDQLRAAARQWDERGRDRGLLWRGEALMELTLWRNRYAGKLTAREDAFTAASFADAARGRRIRRTLAGAAVGVLAIATVILLVMYRTSQQHRRAAEHARGEAHKSAAEASQRLVDLLFEQGRAAAVDGRPLEALVYLDAAHQRGASGAALEYMVGNSIDAIALQRAAFAHASRVTTIAFSSDGRLVATAGGHFDRTVKVWDVATGALVNQLSDLDGGTSSLQFRPGSDDLLVGAPPRTVLWNARTAATRLDVTDAAAGADGRATITPDGTRVLAVFLGTPARLLDGGTGAVVRSIGTTVVSGAISPRGTLIATADADGHVVVTGVDGGAVARIDAGTIVWQLAIAPDDRHVVAATYTDPPRVLVWNRAGALVATIAGHRRAVKSLEIAPDGQQLLTASDDATAKLWRIDTGALITSFEGHAGPVVAARFAPDGRHVATASVDGTAKLWLRADGTEVATLYGHTDALTDLAFSPDGQLATSSIDNTARLWSAGIPSLATELQVATGGRSSVSRLADGSAFAIGEAVPPTLIAATGPVALAGPEPRTPTASIDVPSLETRRIADLAPDRATVAAPVGEDVVVWDRATGAVRGRCSGTAQALFSRFAPDGRRIVIGDAIGAVRICDTSTFASTPLGAHTFYALDGAYDPTGAAIITAGHDKRIVIWRPDGSIERELTGHTNGVSSVRFSADGTRVISASIDATVRVWNRATGEAIVILEAPVPLLAVAASDALIAAAGEDGQIFVWDTATWRLVGVLGIRDAAVDALELAGDQLFASDVTGRLRTWRVTRATALDRLHDYVACNVPYALVDERPQLRPIEPTPACAAITGAVVIGAAP